MNTVIVYGPGRCGKTRFSLRLASTFDCRQVIDEWSNGDKIIAGALHLTACPAETIERSETVRVVSFTEACRLAGIGARELEQQDDRTMQDDS